MCMECQSLIDAIDAYIAKADKKLADELKNAGFAEPEETVRHIEELEEQLADVFIEQSDNFEKLIIEAERNGIDVEEVLEKQFPKFKENDKTGEKLFYIFMASLYEYIPSLANVYIQQLDPELVIEQIIPETAGQIIPKTVGQITPKTIDWIAQWSSELSDLMHLSSHEELESIISSGLKNGKGIAEIARNILDSGIRDEYYKARRVALTEILRAHSVAREEAIQQCPAAEVKTWVHTGNYRIKPRENHVAMNGQTVRKDQNFKLKGADGITYLADFPRDCTLPPGESINCHCTHFSPVSEKILALPLEERRRLQQQAIEEMGDEWKKELDERNKARAGINEDTIKCDWLKGKTAAERKKYFRSDSRWALFESGVIQNDADLDKLYKTVDTKYGQRKVFKTLTELKDDGIITVSKERLDHSSLGDWTSTNRLINGGHSQRCMNKLISNGTQPVIYKEYSNGVRIGSVPDHKNPYKKTGSDKKNCDIGQSWFPKDWDDDKIMLAGTYTANSGTGEGIVRTAVFEDVEVIVFINNGSVGTICPDNMKQPKGDEWEYARD